ncbi:hypothetical protein GPECTOR_6g624 [Gonium pectorale]|uniref:Uncharacterized protein n=1 Tax=Gonium pectorale TaxID=33097 RepID=A0A150GV01_GONPE|nr:hypothetical protein GPECTOR_6g624 [Gonium pectorale]|eukprot:KXZ53707.1 hypothetical protein GPECTOR_6g624 [Gonium pectorale]
MEQELVRQQIMALSQLLSWGQQQSSLGDATGGASDAVPEEPEVERVRVLLCLQAGGNGAFLVGRLREEVAAGGSHSTLGAAEASGPASPTCGRAQGPPVPAGAGRCIHRTAYGVLADALDALVSAAVQNQDFGVVADALELAMLLYTYTGSHTKVRLLHALAGNPYLYTRFAWRGMFSHTLLTLAVATAASGDCSGAAAAAADRSTDGLNGVLDPSDALRRQRALLQGLQRSLCAQATWLMHLGVAEVPAWDLLSGLVSAAGVAELPAAKHDAPSGRASALQISPTANLTVTGCSDSWARLWDVRLGSTRCTPAVSMATRQGGVTSLLLDSGRLRLYTGGQDGTAAEWDLRKVGRWRDGEEG